LFTPSLDPSPWKFHARYRGLSKKAIQLKFSAVRFRILLKTAENHRHQTLCEAPGSRLISHTHLQMAVIGDSICTNPSHYSGRRNYRAALTEKNTPPTVALLTTPAHRLELLRKLPE